MDDDLVFIDEVPAVVAIVELPDDGDDRRFVTRGDDSLLDV